jgi:hypothetical protein
VKPCCRGYLIHSAQLLGSWMMRLIGGDRAVGRYGYVWAIWTQLPVMATVLRARVCPWEPDWIGG